MFRKCESSKLYLDSIRQNSPQKILMAEYKLSLLLLNPQIRCYELSVLQCVNLELQSSGNESESGWQDSD